MAELDSVDAQIAVNGAFAQAEAFVAGVITPEQFESTTAEEIAATVSLLGQAFATSRLSFLAQVASDYPAREYKNKGGGGNPNWKGGNKGASTGTGVTAPQRGLIERLLDEKVGADTVFDGDFGKLDKASASTKIEALIALDDKPDK